MKLQKERSGYLMKIRSGKMKAILLAGMLGLSMTFAPQMTGQATELAVRETVEQEAASGSADIIAFDISAPN